MRGFVFLALAAGFSLSACGASPDDATNLPLSGKWLDEGKLMAVKIGGTSIDPSEMPGIETLNTKVKNTREFCGEPRFVTKEALQELMAENNPANCIVDSLDINGSRVLAKGTCEATQIAEGVEGTASFKGESKMASDKVIYDMAINAVVKNNESGEGEMITIEARRTMTRLGDC